MSEHRRIEQGESLLELAYEGGFDSWQRIWNDPANAALRQQRPDPQALLPGDVVTTPPRRTEPKGSCPVDKIHRFELVRPRAWVNLRMLDGDGEPLEDARYQLRVESQVHEGTTDADGMISVEVSPSAHRGHLTLWLDDPEPILDAPVLVGFLDPASSPSGIRSRLENLGAQVQRLHQHDPKGPLATLGLDASEAEPILERLARHHDETKLG